MRAEKVGRKVGKKKEMILVSRESSNERERDRDREALGAELPMYANGSVAQGDSGMECLGHIHTWTFLQHTVVVGQVITLHITT